MVKAFLVRDVNYRASLVTEQMVVSNSFSHCPFEDQGTSARELKSKAPGEKAATVPPLNAGLHPRRN